MEGRKLEISFYNTCYFFMETLKDPMRGLYELAYLMQEKPNNVNMLYQKIVKESTPSGYEQVLWTEQVDIPRKKMKYLPLSRTKYYALKQKLKERGNYEPRFNQPVLSKYELELIQKMLTNLQWWMDVFKAFNSQEFRGGFW